MKISAMDLEDILALPWEKKLDFLCGEANDNGETADIALLLGTEPVLAAERAAATALLYKSGRIKYVVPSGGVKWDCGGENLSEAELMQRLLINEGVPEDVIFIDNDARTTQENMSCGADVILNTPILSAAKSIMIVTSETHLKRSLALANAIIPKQFGIVGYPAFSGGKITLDEVLKTEELQRRIDWCITLIKGLVDTNTVEDMDIKTAE